MKRIHIRRSLALYVALTFCGLPTSNLVAQAPKAKLEELRRKYPWGSIYLTYIPMSDLTQLLEAPNKLGGVSDTQESTMLDALRQFLKKNRRTPINRDLAFIEINLNTVEAGFKFADDNNGVVTKIPWSQADVLKAAVICDRFLNVSSSARDLYRSMFVGTVSLVGALHGMQAINESPYVPDTRAALLFVSFRRLIQTKAGELNELRQADMQTYAAVEKFKERFDKSSAQWARLKLDGESWDEPELVANLGFNGEWHSFLKPGADIRYRPSSLYARLGGKRAITRIVDEFVDNVAADSRINRFFADTARLPKRIAKFKGNLVNQICQASGGPCKYTGKDMKAAHKGMGISHADFNALVEDLVKALDKFHLGATEKNELLGALGGIKGDIVEK